MFFVKQGGIRIMGIYASPSATADDWSELNTQIRRIRRQGCRSFVSGDLNARHTSWDRGARMSRGRRVVLKLLDRPAAHPLFPLRAPAKPTRFGVTKRGKITAFCLDMFLTSPGRGGWAEKVRVMIIDGVEGSDHVPVVISPRSEKQTGYKTEEIFHPEPHKLKGKRLRHIKDAYAESLTIIAEKS